MADDVFLDWVNGSNSNGGTSLVDAFKSPMAAGWSAAITAGARIIIKGDAADAATHYRPVDITELLTFQFLLTSKTNVTVIPYDDLGYCIRGDVVLASGSWTNVSGTIYKQNIGADLIASGSGSESKQLGVTWNYDENTTTLIPGYPAAHYGILAAGTSSTVAVGESFYDRTSGDLFINVGGNPALGVVTVCRGKSDSLIKWTTATGVRWYGGTGRLCSLHNTSVGYIFERSGSTDCLIDGFQAFDGGYHNIGGIGAGNVRNVIKNCYAEGGGDTGTLFVEYAQSGTHKGTRLIDCTALVRTHLGIDGTPNGGSGSNQTGFYFHYGSGQDVVEDLEFLRCGAQCYSPSSPGIRGYGGVDVSTNFAGSRYERTNRQVRYVDCWSRNDTSWTINAPIYVLRGDFRFTNAGPLGAAGSTGCLRFSTDGGGTAKRGIPLFEGTLIQFDLDNASTQYAMRAQSSPTYYDDGTGEYEGPTFLGCTIVDIGDSTNQAVLFDYQTEANFAFAVQSCIVGYTARGGSNQKLCSSDGSLAAGVHLFERNHYIGIGTSNDYSANTSFDTKAEWTSAIDANGKYTDSGSGIFRDVTTTDASASRPAASAITDVRFTPTRRPLCDVWGRPFMGQHGCWQEQPGEIRGYPADTFSFRRAAR
jgi:hypothetical protein